MNIYWGGKKKTKKRKSKKNKTLKKKQLFIIPDKNKTVWSSDFFGERQVLDFKNYIVRSKVDNLNTIKGKNSKDIRKEYERRIKIQLKKNKSSRKKFNNKTKKKYSKRSIDKQIGHMSNNQIETLYKSLL